MVVIHLVCSVDDVRPRVTGPPGLSVRRLVADRDAELVSRVVESAQGDDFPPLRTAGLLAELAGRPGRSVESWVALLDGTAAGLLALAATGEGHSTRHSIAWLLVSRHVRRQGIATALVAAALESVRDRGGMEVWVETRSDWFVAAAFWQDIGCRPAG